MLWKRCRSKALAELVSVAERIGALQSGLEGLDRSSPWRAKTWRRHHHQAGVAIPNARYPPLDRRGDAASAGPQTGCASAQADRGGDRKRIPTPQSSSRWMSPDELADLAEDIKANGLKHPIVLGLYQDRQVVVDGRNRQDACAMAGVEPQFTKLNGEDIKAFIVSNNIKRRHLNSGQRAMAVAMNVPGRDAR